MFSITVGEGGKHSDYTVVGDGQDGQDTIVNITTEGISILAKGGRGGSNSSGTYQGNGNQKISDCYSRTYYDGIHSERPGQISCYGGQASNFGNGGSRSGQITGYGAGGSAISKHQQPYDRPSFCEGGNGLVIVRWDIDDKIPENVELQPIADSKNLAGILDNRYNISNHLAGLYYFEKHLSEPEDNEATIQNEKKDK